MFNRSSSIAYIQYKSRAEHLRAVGEEVDDDKENTSDVDESDHEEGDDKKPEEADNNQNAKSKNKKHNASNYSIGSKHSKRGKKTEGNKDNDEEKQQSDGKFYRPHLTKVASILSIQSTNDRRVKLIKQRAQFSRMFSKSSNFSGLSHSGESGDIEVVTEEDIKKLRWKYKLHFWWFSWIASLNQTLSYVYVFYVSSLLGDALGSVVSGLLWTLNGMAGLCVATSAVRIMGVKSAMILALAGYTIQIAGLYWAILRTTSTTTGWIVTIIGSTIAGITSAIWWTAQGVYFESICEDIAHLSTGSNSKQIARELDTLRNELSAHWTIIYQLAHILLFISLSIFPWFISDATINTMILIMVLIGVVATLLGFTFAEVENNFSELSWNEIYRSIIAVPEQLREDSRVTLLTPFTFQFGITTAMFALYVNSAISSSSLGVLALGFLEAFSYFIASIAAYPYAYIGFHFERGNDFIMQFGTLSFLLSAVMILVLDSDQLGSWTNLLILKGLYGLGIGVFEGACRGVYGSLFSGEDLSTAFSQQTLATGISGGIAFFVFSALSKTAITSITIANGVIALLCYTILMYHPKRFHRIQWSTLFFGGEVEDEMVLSAVTLEISRSMTEKEVDKYAVI